MKYLTSLMLIGLVSLSIVACKKGDSGYQPQVANNPDNFSFQANNSTNLSSTYDYTWTNSGQTAQIGVSSTITTGTANVSITDASGVQVYSNDVQTNGSFTTSMGTAGTWKIHVTLSGANGNVSFTVQKH